MTVVNCDMISNEEIIFLAIDDKFQLVLANLNLAYLH